MAVDPWYDRTKTVRVKIGDKVFTLPGTRHARVVPSKILDKAAK